MNSKTDKGLLFDDLLLIKGFPVIASIYKRRDKDIS